jgi:transcriptional regulator with XRE-family HTH domain
MFEDEDGVRPDGHTVRRLRHERGWSPRHLVDAIERANLESTGVRRTITPNVLSAIEERNERVPYETLCLVSAGFDCDPIDLLLTDQDDPLEPDEDEGERDDG